MKVNENYQGMIYAVGYSYGTSSNGTTYVNILVSKTQTPTTRSQFSIYCDDELAIKIGIDMKSLSYPAKGERQSRMALPAAIPLEEATLVTVEHSPIQINDRTYRTLTLVVRADESAQSVADAAVQRRFDNVDAKFFQKEDFAKDYQRYILPDAVGRDELIQWLKNLD